MKICVIPARGGSKRIPRKNIKDFNGKPVIAYPIQAALDSKLFDKVLVSTDDEEIMQIARQYGAQVPFVRPEHLANDTAATIPVLKHAVEWFEQQGQMVKELVCLYPVNPFVEANLLRDVFQHWQLKRFDACYGVCEFASAPQRGFELDQHGALQRCYPEFTNTRTQDLQKNYFDSGMFYFFKVASLFGPEAVGELTIQPYFLEPERVHDIDTFQDWKMAELWHEVLGLQDRKSQLVKTSV